MGEPANNTIGTENGVQEHPVFHDDSGEVQAMNRSRESLDERAAAAAARAKAIREARTERIRNTQPVRAINEDDDGYDPYSDFHDRNTAEPLFERNPWD